MKKNILVITSILLIGTAYCQTVSQNLQKAFQQFESDGQLKHAISSLYIIDAGTGQVVFDKNSQVGLAPASTQKIITSVTAFELLGKDFRYKTRLGYQGTVSGRKLTNRIFVLPSGDPTFGSWRYANTREPEIVSQFTKSIKALKADTVNYLLYVDDSKFEVTNTPDGWIWQDIGNYYGAGSGALNWRENQYEIVLRSGNSIGDPVELVDIKPSLWSNHEIISKVTTAAKGSGDNAYIYQASGAGTMYIKGTIPAGEKRFTITGATPSPVLEFQGRLVDTLRKAGITGLYDLSTIFDTGQDFDPINEKTSTFIYTHYSPTLDSIVYWFNKKSINLYGEALIKTFAYEKQGFGSTDSGVSIVRKFWKGKGIEEDELNIYDGSGLSPLNRVTTHAQVEILKYAKSREWFSSFYNSLPDYNGMRMKSGTISDVKGFCGYHKAKNGKEYIFSFLVNNYGGKTSGLVNKMYKVLDELK